MFWYSEEGLEFTALLSQVQSFEKQKLKHQKTSDKTATTLGIRSLPAEK